MDEFDFEFGQPALQLMPTATENKGAGLLWLLVILGVVVLGLMLYQLLQETRPPREKPSPNAL